MPSIGMQEPRCRCPNCLDYTMDDELLDYVAESTRFVNAFSEGLDPHQYCISCYNNRCYEGRSHL